MAGVLLAYAKSFSGARAYDDRAAITENGSIRDLTALGQAFHAPPEAGSAGRPVANFTFALSYALSGLQPWGYHLLSVTIHGLAALALFGVVRRTLLRPVLRDRSGREATALAGASALLWAVHPLQTQTVTYLSQRTESLMGLFYLLTLYCFIRSIEERPRIWQALSVGSCLLGVMSKEVCATAPLLVLLYDRTFVAGTFSGGLRARVYFYSALAATWLVLAWLLVGVSKRGVGYDLGISWIDYALTECKAVLLYGSLGVWPHPLIFDRGVTLLTSFADAAPYLVGLVALLAGALWAVVRRPALGFAAAWFFVILAPASSVIPVIQQPIAENRPYLPLAGLVALGVLGLRFCLGRRTTLAACALLAATALAATVQRNRDYRTEASIWADTVAKTPGNARAHYNLGVVLDHLGQRAAAMEQYRAAITCAPTYAAPHNNLGNALVEERRIAEAQPYLERALDLKPDYADAHYNLGNAYLHSGRFADAIPHYETALRLEPQRPKAANNLAICLLQTGHADDAIREFNHSLSLQPDFFDAHTNLAVALMQTGRNPEALAHLETALRLQPDSAPVRATIDRVRAEMAAAGPKP